MRKIKYWIALVLLVVATAIPESARANNFPTDEIEDFFGESLVFWYNPFETLEIPNRDSCGGYGDIQVSGDTFTEMIWSGLRSAGMTEIQAAAITGTLAQESGHNPFRHEQEFLNACSASALPNCAPGDTSVSCRCSDWNLMNNTDISYGVGILQFSGGRRTNLLRQLEERRSDLLPYMLDPFGVGSNRGLDEVDPSVITDMVGFQLRFMLDELEAAAANSSSNIMYAGPRAFLNQSPQDIDNRWCGGPMSDELGYYICAFQTFTRSCYWSSNGTGRGTPRCAAQHTTNSYLENVIGPHARQILAEFSGRSYTNMGTNAVDISSDGTIFVGDQRMHAVCEALGLSLCLAEAGAGAGWLSSNAAAAAALHSGGPIVVSLGIDHLGDAAAIASTINSLASGAWAGRRIVVAGVPAVDEAMATTVTNAEVQAFNDELSSGITADGVRYCDATISGFSTTDDGINLDTAGAELFYSTLVNTCGRGSNTHCPPGHLVSGGMSLAEAEALAERYNTDPEVLEFMQGRMLNPLPDCPSQDPRRNCSTFSRWFVENFTGVLHEGRVGDGWSVAQNIANQRGWQRGLTSEGAVPRAYSVFSYGDGTSGNNHTGIVVGVEGNSVIIIHAGYCQFGGRAEVMDWDTWSRNRPDLNFAYIPDDELNFGGW
ncbi:phage tail tip lysozyme [Candidatus Saccharibacteria bacterium]|nr:phage tail tip lysozyme [Candidatus Saccharibacteria bacterium]